MKHSRSVERFQLLSVILLFIVAMILFQLGFLALEDSGVGIRRVIASEPASPSLCTMGHK